MKVILVHIAFRIIGIALLTIFLFLLFFYEGGDWSLIGIGMLFAVNISFLVAAPFFLVEAHSLYQKKLKHKSRASLALGGVSLLIGLSFFYILFDGLV